MITMMVVMVDMEVVAMEDMEAVVTMEEVKYYIFTVAIPYQAEAVVMEVRFP